MTNQSQLAINHISFGCMCEIIPKLTNNWQ